MKTPFSFPFSLSAIYKTCLFLVSFVVSASLQAKEGMWLPPLLDRQEAEMQKMGLEIPVSQLYNADGTGLNQAIVLFGRGCTGEVISPKGLVLTNHHCGYGTVQGLSSADKDYFAKGFWAMSPEEEIPCPGLTVSFVRRMENVTEKILYSLPDTLSSPLRDSLIERRTRTLETEYERLTGLTAQIKPFYHGNQYWVSLIETFRDVRLTAFPEDGIGRFGGDTDNWMWPRHTGDFALFRIYAGADNKPADYDPGNQPYQSPRFFVINNGGIKEGDFTMVYGFPASTREYISSMELQETQEIINPVRIEVRTAILDIWNERMEASRDIFLQYASKKARLSNGWKKWQGELMGLEKNQVLAKKQDYERQFQSRASRDDRYPYLDQLLPSMEANSLAARRYIRASEYIREALFGVEILRQSSRLKSFLELYSRESDPQRLARGIDSLIEAQESFFRNYDRETDRRVFSTLIPLYMQAVPEFVPQALETPYLRHGKNMESWSQSMYRSLLSSRESLARLKADPRPADSMIILSDPAYALQAALNQWVKEEILPPLQRYEQRKKELHRLYMKGQLHLDRNRNFYPDANFTLRLSYGQVEPLDYPGSPSSSYQTFLGEAVAKADSSVSEFHMPGRLMQIYEDKDFGGWAVNDSLPLCFIASNHTSGGNSGSPVLNARGELIGTNFDRVWEGTMSDLYFDPQLCRNISVDIRYTLFLIDRYGGAGWLLDEMKLTHPRRR